MSDLKFHDFIPENARVLVDYAQPPQDRVKFTYPKERTYEEGLRHGGRSTFHMVGLVIWILTIIYIGVFLAGFFGTHYLILALTSPRLIIPPKPALTFSWQAFWANLYKTYFTNYSFTTTTTYFNSGLQNMLITIFALYTLFLLFIFPQIAILYYRNKKERLAEIVPTLNYKCLKLLRFGSVKYMKAKAEDIHNNLFLLPRFQNVYLDYSATGDMGKQLEKISVMEYEYGYQTLKANGKLKEKEIEEYRWYTFFKFKEQPKDGELEIKYI